MREKQKALFDEWRIHRPEIVTDGIVNEEAYSKSKIKILYLLKEVNGGENWDLCEFIASGARAQTWNNITRWTMGIQNLDKDFHWKDMENISENQRKDILKSICAVNVKKTSGGHTADSKKLEEAAKEDSVLLRRQLAIYEPEIIVCCGTDWLYFDYIYNYKPEWKMTSHGIWYVRDEEKIIISYSHPEARTKDCLLYYGLVDAIKEIVGI